VAAGDRLSSLPDDLLHTIMSFIPVRQAVQTCVLSRRWEHLWCSMPCLNINQPEFDLATSGASGGSRFEEFVNNLLMFHSASSLDMFRLHVTHSYESKVVERWIRRGMKCCPAMMEVYAPSRRYGLPHLGSSSYHLRRLHLVKIALDKSFPWQLSSGCPVLEDLKLDGCLLGCPEITSCTLRNLIVADCMNYGGNVLTITAPALVSFYLVITVGWNWDVVLVNEMPALVKATVCLKQDRQSTSSSPKEPCKLLRNLINVKDLELSGLKTLSILHGESGDTFPTFSNLRTLLFDGCDLSDDFQMLGCFLNNSPSLEKLTLQYCKLPEGSKKRKRMENPKRMSIKCHDALTFQCPSLKLTEIKYKEDDVHQLFGLLSGIWRNLRKTTIILTKA